MDLDEKDLLIMDILKNDSKLTTGQISKKTRIPITTVHNRIKKLESFGVIKSYTVVLDYKKLNKPILAYVLITVSYNLPSGKKVDQEILARQIRSFSEVEEVGITAGETDIIIKVRLQDVESLNDFVIKKLRSLDGIDKTKTMIVLNNL